MDTHHIDHIAIRVESLRQAENFYTRLFLMERAPQSDEDDAVRMLYRHDLRVALHRTSDELAPNSRFDHVAILVPHADVARIGEAAFELGCVVRSHGPDEVIFEDPYGLCWEVLTTPRR